MKSREERIVMELFAEHCRKEAMKKRKHNPLTNMIHKTANMISEPIKEEDTKCMHNRMNGWCWIPEWASIYIATLVFMFLLILMLLIFS